jgi:ATP-dependent helicase Lhr and Lhr-like helicase
VLGSLRRRGASFFAELQRITGLERCEVERGLWELVAAGFVTADAFDNLRGLMLARYGVVFRELLARETNVPRWRQLQWALRRMEERGEVRGGRFVSGFAGEQFALPAAVESVRALRQLAPSGETITLSAADPLNLVGILVPGDRISPIGSRNLSFREGVFVGAGGAPSPPEASGDTGTEDGTGSEAAM